MTYQVIKKINGIDYVYEQSTYKDDSGKTHTIAKYVGPANPNRYDKQIQEELAAEKEYKELALQNPQDDEKLLEIANEEHTHSKELKSLEGNTPKDKWDEDWYKRKHRTNAVQSEIPKGNESGWDEEWLRH
jgi:hypothetical protein